YPDGRIYIEKLLNNNWEIEAAISLGQWSPKWLVESGLRYASIPWSNKSQHTNTEEKQSESLSNVGYDNAPGSVVAARVRKFFEWV
ncbi:hypothetical protein, partial [Nisaea nitritireducens]|uniref:hypothetical protein n=1 Tax=Nisaea nitritireducens TaxID=568392 RepID=UPI001D032405